MKPTDDKSGVPLMANACGLSSGVGVCDGRTGSVSHSLCVAASGLHTPDL